jgi:hypothetical protein
MFQKIIYYLIDWSLLIDTVISWEYTASTDWMIVNKCHELEGIWKETSVVSRKMQSRRVGEFVSRPKFEPVTSRIQARSFTDRANFFGLSVPYHTRRRLYEYSNAILMCNRFGNVALAELPQD